MFEDNAPHPSLADLMTKIVTSLENMGLYTDLVAMNVDGRCNEDDVEHEHCQTIDASVDLKSELAAGDTKIRFQYVVSFGGLALSDDMCYPERVKAERDFLLAVPTEAEMAFDDIKRYLEEHDDDED